MSINGPQKWQKIRTFLAFSLLGGALFGLALSYWLWGKSAAAACFGTVFCLALGFWITEQLIGALTGVKKLNVPGLILLAAGKFAWWAGLFLGSKHLPRQSEGGVAVGMGVFLLAVVISALSQYGLPRISDGNSSGAS